MDNTIVQWLVALVFLGFTGYSTYKTIRMYQAFKKGLAQFKEVHGEAEQYREGKLWIASLIVVAIFCAVLTFLPNIVPGTNQSQLFYYHLAYGCFAIIFFGIALEAYMRRQVWFSKEGMFYIDTYYRFRMIMSYELQGSVIKNVSILMGNRDKIEVTRKMGQEIKHRQEAWKADKKASRHKRGK